jgi:hypothetical protein
MTALLFLAMWASSSPQEKTDLRWRPKPEDSLRFRLTLDLQTVGSNIRIEGDLGMLVNRVDPAGAYDVRTTVVNKTLSVDGVKQRLKDDPATVEKFDPKGRKVAGGPPPSDDDNPLDLLDLITEASLPDGSMAPDERWEKAIKADAKLKREAATVRCRLNKPSVVQDIPCWRVTFEYRQAKAESIEADGSFCVSVADGSLVLFEANMRNLVLTDDGNTTTANVVMRRQRAVAPREARSTGGSGLRTIPSPR